MSLAKADGPVEWRPLTKDGVPVPAEDSAPGPATQTMVDAPVPEELRAVVAERRKIIEALDQCGGNQTEAARLLGMSRRTEAAVYASERRRSSH